MAPRVLSRWKQSLSWIFLLTEHSTLQRHKTWSLSHPSPQVRAWGAQRGSQSCESGMGWHWMSEFETSLEEPDRSPSDFPRSSQQEQLQLDPDTMTRQLTVPCDTQRRSDMESPHSLSLDHPEMSPWRCEQRWNYPDRVSRGRCVPTVQKTNRPSFIPQMMETLLLIESLKLQSRLISPISQNILSWKRSIGIIESISEMNGPYGDQISIISTGH